MICSALDAHVPGIPRSGSKEERDTVAEAGLYTIGHSTHPSDIMIGLLDRHRIQCIVDVRSVPYSRHNPQYNRETLIATLGSAGLVYEYLGRELGPRTPDDTCYDGDRVNYGRLAATPLFREGLVRLGALRSAARVALLCAERDPLFCHRLILICRALRDTIPDIAHIGADGVLESQAAAEQRLVKEVGLTQPDLFSSAEDVVARAYDVQGARIAYRKRPPVG
jgi:uncharacterized protein (DUF488 family)